MANSKTRPMTRMLAKLLALFTLFGVIGTSPLHIYGNGACIDEYVPQAAQTFTVFADKTTTVTFSNTLKRGTLKVCLIGSAIR